MKLQIRTFQSIFLFLTFFCWLNAGIAQVSFTANTTVGCAPLLVNFTPQPTGATSYYWDFGNGTSSTLENPGIIYTSSGLYTISLTVTLPGGAIHTFSQTDYIQVTSSPTADFSVNIDTICQGETVQFTDLSTPGDNPITSWTWEFGDGGISSSKNPSHTYNTAGFFLVKLQVSDPNGCTGLALKPGFVLVKPTPDASFVASSALGCSAPFSVQMFSAPNAGSVVHWWNFGNAQTSSDADPTVTYNANGNYSVIHIVTDTVAGCSDTSIVPNLISVGQSTFTIQMSDNEICAGETVDFICGAGPSSTVQWDFGVLGGTSTACDTSFTFSTPGLYNISLFITDAVGCNYISGAALTVHPNPVANFFATDTLFCNPVFDVNFVNSSTGAVSYEWDFGDGGVSTNMNPNHIYPVLPLVSNTGQPYYYDVQLIATNAAGCKDTLEQANYITTGQTAAFFHADPFNGCAPVEASFFNNSLSPSPIISYQWDLDISTSTLENPIQMYVDTGYYDVTLIIETLHGCKDTLTIFDYIQVGDTPIADFMPDTTIACAYEGIHFTNLSQFANSYLWIFSDGGTSSEFEPTPTYVFQDTGFIDVTLIAYDRGCPDTMMMTQAVFSDSGVAIFTPLDTTVCDTIVTIQYTDASIAAHSWFWEFGDGSLDSTSTLPSPVHTFHGEGTYVVTLTITNDSTGCEYTRFGQVKLSPVEASFTPSVTSGCAPLTVTFVDSSYNASFWAWDMGDGTVYNPGNPVISHTFTKPGIYPVTLVMLDDDFFCSDDTTILISVFGPEPGFFADTLKLCVPYPVNFTDTTSSIAPIVSWDWDFGVPGGTSMLQNPIYTYTDPGIFGVSLLVTDSVGCSANVVKNTYIDGTRPAADFIVPHPYNCPNNPIQFVNQSQGVNLTYAWNFGDMGTSTDFNPLHTYTIPGIYDVTLTVTDPNGCDSTIVYPGLITIEVPQIDFVADTNYADCPPLLVNFTATVLSGHNFGSWFWTFGDGNNSPLQNPSNLYTTVNTFDVTVIASASSGCTAIETQPGMISVNGPTGAFTIFPAEACPGDTITFTGSGSNVEVFQWDLGAGMVPTGQVVTTTYSSPGVYYPVLIVEDSNGCQILVNSVDSVIIHQVPNANFVANYSTLCDSGIVSFTDLSSSFDPITQWSWNFGDMMGTSTTQNPNYTYTQPGIYDVELIVTSSFGCKDTITLPDTVTVFASPIAAVAVSDTVGCVPLGIGFSDISPPTNAAITNWFWDFNSIPPATSSLPSPNYTYQIAGIYNPSLTITDINGCSGTASTTVEAYPLPAVNFAADDSFGCAPKFVQFKDLSPNSVGWIWNFGDGTPFTDEEDPLHLYQFDGVFSVSLTVTNVFGCIDSFTKPNYIVLDHPDANFTLGNDIVCPDVPVQFFDLSQSDTLLVGWNWDFGNGDFSTQQNPAYPFPNSGFYDIQLIVTDVFGCTDTLVQPELVEVLVNEVPEIPEIQFVTVVGSSQIRLFFDAYENIRNDFDHYVIHRQVNGGAWTSVGTIFDINETEFRDGNVATEQNAYCYRLQIVNYCGLASELEDAEIHCAIWLMTTPQIDMIDINWTPYQGWDFVSRYDLYRVQNYNMSTASLIASLSGTETSFTDTNMFCYDEYTYRVEAFEEGPNTSLSNISREGPIHFGPPNPMQMAVATVDQDSFVTIRWQDIPEGDDLVSVRIEKMIDNQWQTLLTQSVNSPVREYLDYDVNVHQQSYQYRAYVVDTCGDETPGGLIAKSILLMTRRDGGTMLLEWTPYRDWKLGVSRYEIQVFNEATGQYDQVAIVPGNQTNFADRKTELPQDNYCYRIIGYESAGNQEISISNESCVQPRAYLYFPNAFTPNGDFFNDRFLVLGVFLESFRMEIYNRWGKQIYVTENMQEGWDGTAEGEAVPEGVFVFKVSGKGIDGDWIHRSGTVTLIR